MRPEARSLRAGPLPFSLRGVAVRTFVDCAMVSSQWTRRHRDEGPVQEAQALGIPEKMRACSGIGGPGQAQASGAWSSDRRSSQGQRFFSRVGAQPPFESNEQAREGVRVVNALHRLREEPGGGELLDLSATQD